MSLHRSWPRRSAAVALVAGAVSLPSVACAAESGPPADALAAVSWDKYVRSCSVDEGGSGLGTVIDGVVKADVTGDERVDTLVIDQCESSTSPWPQVVEVFDGASDPGSPRRLGVLLDGDSSGPSDIALAVEPGGRVVITGRGLSDTAPLCCPDLALRRVYRYDAGSFNLVESTASPMPSPS